MDFKKIFEKKSDLDKFTAQYLSIDEAVPKITEISRRILKTQDAPYGDFQNWLVDGEEIRFNFERYSCGDTDYDELFIPLKVLMFDKAELVNYFLDKKEEIRIEREEMAKKIEVNKKEQLKIQDEKEYEKYLVLKEKFEKK